MSDATATLREIASQTDGRVRPHSDEAEISVLGGMLLEETAVDYALEYLSEDDFYQPAHRILFNSIVSIRNKGYMPDALSVREDLKSKNKLEDVGGEEYLKQIVEIVPTAANIKYHARMVLDYSVKRKLIDSASKIASETIESTDDSDVLLDRAEELIFRLGDRRFKKSFVSLGDMLQEVVFQLESQSSAEGITGAPSGFSDLDQLTAGFQLSDLVIVAARPSIGKTSFALNVAANLAIENQTPVAVFSLEMSAEQLAQRLICSESGISLRSLRTGSASPAEWARVSEACDTLRRAPIYIDDSGLINPLELRAKARRLKQQADVGLVIVDYLQLMEARGRAENRQQEITQISRSLKALAKELRVPVVALSQLSRAAEQSDRPKLSHLRESGAIEQDADLVIFLHRDDKKDEEGRIVRSDLIEFIVGKNRNGPIGDIRLLFKGDQMRFYDYDGRYDDESFGY